MKVDFTKWIILLRILLIHMNKSVFSYFYCAFVGCIGKSQKTTKAFNHLNLHFKAIICQTEWVLASDCCALVHCQVYKMETFMEVKGTLLWPFLEAHGTFPWPFLDYRPYFYNPLFKCKSAFFMTVYLRSGHFSKTLYWSTGHFSVTLYYDTGPFCMAL